MRESAKPVAAGVAGVRRRKQTEWPNVKGQPDPPLTSAATRFIFDKGVDEGLLTSRRRLPRGFSRQVWRCRVSSADGIRPTLES